MEFLIGVVLSGLGVLCLTLTGWLLSHTKAPRKPELTKAERIALETARLEKENQRLAKQYEDSRVEELDRLTAPSDDN